MLTRALFVVALLMPQLVAAADLRPVRRHHVVHREARVPADNKVFTCTTTDVVIIAYSNCGQGFDPLVFSGY